MSSRMINGSQLDEISKYIDRMKEVKMSAESMTNKLRAERDDLDVQIAELEARREAVDRKMRAEKERAERHERAIEQASQTFEKLLESTRNLAEFVKKEYQDARSNSTDG